MLSRLDLFVLITSLVLVMAVGLLAGRREETEEDYFLAGRSVRWWGVAGSIFATNVSANHLVGMLGVGFSIGFAQSHFELGAIFALLLLAYVLLPVYTRLRIYTLSQYLAIRYDERVAIAYSVFTLFLIVVQMTALFYIGSRSLNLLLGENAPGYVGGILLLASVSAVYTIFGGLKAVIWTDVVQTGLLLAAGVLVALATFAEPEVGGFSGLLERDAALPVAEQKMHLYLPASHPEVPWTGVFTGLLLMHVSFWCTNQTIVQRTMAAASLRQARAGILLGGSLKLLVPFFSVAAGVAAAQLFAVRLPETSVSPDDAFPTLMTLVLPMGYGLQGLVAAGLVGAILSTLDSLMNSGATLAVVDLYQKHVEPDATDARLVALGRLCVLGLAASSALMAAATYDPESRGLFFLGLTRQISYLTPGMLVAFLLGMADPGARARGALVAIAAAPLLGLGLESAYAALAPITPLPGWLGPQLNFMHRTFLTIVLCFALHALVSRTAAADPAARSRFARSGGLPAGQLRPLTYAFFAWTAGNALLAGLVVAGWLPPWLAGLAGAAFTLAIFGAFSRRHPRASEVADEEPDDRLWAGLLAAATTFLLFAFF